jgi:hypothetical protein
MENRWTDAARTAALAVRQARALAGRPVAGVAKAKPKKALSRPKPNPMVYAGGSATFDERTGKNKVPEKNIWIPPPDSPHWKDPKFVESFKRAVEQRKKASTVPPPNIFYSSTYPQGGPWKADNQGIIRYDPNDPDLAARLGYPGAKRSQKTPQRLPPRVVIKGKRYTRVGGKLIADVR